MTDFTIHSVETAPEGSKENLAAIAKKYGGVPGLFGAFAESPVVLEAYPAISDLFGKTSLSAQEQQVVAIAASVENECLFCVPAHSYVAKHVAGMDAAIVTALREARATGNARFDALANLTREIVRHRGHPSEAVLAAFLAAGFSRAQVLEVVLGVVMKTFSNYTAHLTDPPLGMFEAERWTPASKARAA